MTFCRRPNTASGCADALTCCHILLVPLSVCAQASTGQHAQPWRDVTLAYLLLVFQAFWSVVGALLCLRGAVRDSLVVSVRACVPWAALAHPYDKMRNNQRRNEKEEQFGVWACKGGWSIWWEGRSRRGRSMAGRSRRGRFRRGAQTHVVFSLLYKSFS